MRLKKSNLGAALAAMTVTGSQRLQILFKPGEGITVKPARATWDTGFFRKHLFDAALKRLGMMSKSLDIGQSHLYKTVTLGDIGLLDQWLVSMHNDQLPSNFDEKAEKLVMLLKPVD